MHLSPALKKALQLKQIKKKNSASSRTKDSPYYFSGKNNDDETLFTCSLCGGSVIGYRNSSKHWEKYICTQNRYKGDAYCTSNLKIDVKWLENKILQEIENLYT